MYSVNVFWHIFFENSDISLLRILTYTSFEIIYLSVGMIYVFWHRPPLLTRTTRWSTVQLLQRFTVYTHIWFPRPTHLHHMVMHRSNVSIFHSIYTYMNSHTLHTCTTRWSTVQMSQRFTVYIYIYVFPHPTHLHHAVKHRSTASTFHSIYTYINSHAQPTCTTRWRTVQFSQRFTVYIYIHVFPHPTHLHHAAKHPLIVSTFHSIYIYMYSHTLPTCTTQRRTVQVSQRFTVGFCRTNRLAKVGIVTDPAKKISNISHVHT